MILKLILIGVGVIFSYWQAKKFLEKRDDENEHQRTMRWLFNIWQFCLCCAVTYSVVFALYLIYKYMDYNELIPPSALEMLIDLWNIS